MTSAAREGFHSVTPHIVVRGAADAIAFYQKAFGATEVLRMPGPDGQTIMHAEVRIGDSIVMLTDENPQMGSQSPQALGGTPVTLHIYVADVDATYQQAVAAGAVGVMEPADMFWGDRYGRLMDPYGHAWALASHQRDVSPEEMQKALAQMG